MKKYSRFLSENFKFLEVKFSVYLNRRVFVMHSFCGEIRKLLTGIFLFSGALHKCV